MGLDLSNTKCLLNQFATPAARPATFRASARLEADLAALAFLASATPAARPDTGLPTALRLLAVVPADVVAADTAAGRSRATTAGWRVTFLATAPSPPLATASLAAEDAGRAASTAAR